MLRGRLAWVHGHRGRLAGDGFVGSGAASHRCVGTGAASQEIDAWAQLPPRKRWIRGLRDRLAELCERRGFLTGLCGDLPMWSSLVVALQGIPFR